jgi:general secretion pathway protein F
MPLYHYQVLDKMSKKRSGLIEAQNEKEGKDKLRDQGLMVIKIVPKTKGSSKENLRGESLMTFTLQLNQLLDAGIPLYESLVALEEQYRTEPYHRILLSLCEQIKAGTPLSQAMAGYPGSFDDLYCSMIAAGESSGALNVILERLTHLLSKQMKLKRQIQTAMIYPCILASFSLLIIIMLLGFVVPSIEGIFEGRNLNTFTKVIIETSHFFQNYWWAYIPLTGGAIAWIVYQARSSKWRHWRERNILKIPLLKSLIIQTSVARFCRTMGTMLQGGVSIIEALVISRKVMHNVVLEEEVKKAEGKIIEGSSLSHELESSKWFPQLVARMLAVGEESGTTTLMLNKIADMYEDELEKTLDQLMALAQPIILVFMGSIIGLVLMAILLPLTDVSSLSM